jgi:hypothetical protein
MLLPSKGRPVLWLVVSFTFAVSLAFASVLFAASAQAQEANAPESTMEAPAAKAAPESGVPPEPTTPPASEQVPPTGEQTTPAIEQTPLASEEADVVVEQPQPSDEHEQSSSATKESISTAEPTPPAAEDPPSTSEPTPPAAEDPPSTSEPTPPAAEKTPPTGVVAPPTAEEAPPAHEQETTEQTSKAGGEASSEGQPSEGTGDSQTSASASGSDRKEPVGEVAPAVSIVATGAGTTAPMLVVSMPPGESQAPVMLEPSTSSARRQARQVRSELAAFGASMFATGSVGHWLDTPETSSVSTIAFAALEASSVATITRVVPTSNESSGLAVANHTSAPGTGGSAPGGAGGGSATGAGSSAASSASSIFVDTLLQSVPNVMRRLCISQSSWHTSFFALIPELPG